MNDEMRYRTIALLSLSLILFVAFLTVEAIAQNQQSNSNVSGKAAEPKPITGEEKEELLKEMDRYHTRYDNGSKWWSVAFHLSTYLAAILSALAALIIKLDYFQDKKYRNDLSAILAATAAVLITISTTGAFNRKWLANRSGRIGIEQLKIQLNDIDAKQARQTLKEIVDKQSKEVSGQ